MEIALVAAGLVVGVGLGFLLFRPRQSAPEPEVAAEQPLGDPGEPATEADETIRPADDTPGADDGPDELEQLQQRSARLGGRVDELEQTVRRYRRWAGIQLQRLTDGLESAWREAGLQRRVHDPGSPRDEAHRTKIRNLAETMREWMDEVEIGTPEAWYQLGLCWALDGRYEEASRAFQEAAHQGLGRDASLALADSLWQLGRPKAACRYYDELMRADTVPEHVRFRLAATAVADGRNEEGLAALAPLLKRRRNPEEVSELACTALTRLERFEDAVKACEKGLNQHKKSARLMAAMLIPLSHLEDSDGRLETTYEAAVELDPELAEVPYAMGVARLTADDDEGAESFLEEALILDDGHAQAHHHLGLIYNRRGEFGKALTSFRRAVELKPDYAEAFYHMKDAYEGLRDFENAIAVLNRAVQLRPDLE